MRPIGLAVVLVISVLAPLAADAQSPRTTPRIGWLTTYSSSDPQAQRGVDLIRQAFRELGHVEGQTIVIEYRWAEGEARTASRACHRTGPFEGRRHRGGRR